MNKQELIEKYEYMSHACFRRVDTLEVLKDLRQLDEPQKVTVPQFVADVIECAREQSAELEDAFEYARDAAFRGELGEWFMRLENRNTFARAWLDGYEVEKEPKYTVKIKRISGYATHLNKRLDDQNWFFASKNEIYGYRVKHTRKELEDAGFGWVFDFPGIEVLEVKE